jgi:hypothetical protein
LKRKTKSANSVLSAFLDSSVNHASHKSNLSEAKRICQFPVIEEWVVDLHDAKQRGDMHPLNPLGFVGCNAWFYIIIIEGTVHYLSLSALGKMDHNPAASEEAKHFGGFHAQVGAVDSALLPDAPHIWMLSVALAFALESHQSLVRGPPWNLAQIDCSLD